MKYMFFLILSILSIHCNSTTELEDHEVLLNSYLPLNIGNYWKYIVYFNNTSLRYSPKIDTGIVELNVLAKNDFVDHIEWIISQKTIYKTYVGLNQYFEYKIIESKNGNHQLTSEFNSDIEFPFISSSWDPESPIPDSSLIFRYYNNNPSNIKSVNVKYGSLGYSYENNYVFKENVGLVLAHRNHVDTGVNISWVRKDSLIQYILN